MCRDSDGLSVAVEIKRRGEIDGVEQLLARELGGQVEVAHDLAQREPAHLTVVGREGTVLEHWMRERVRRRHGNRQTGLGQRPGETHAVQKSKQPG